jgi:hypothetical protein
MHYSKIQPSKIQKYKTTTNHNKSLQNSSKKTKQRKIHTAMISFKAMIKVEEHTKTMHRKVVKKI